VERLPQPDERIARGTSTFLTDPVHRNLYADEQIASPSSAAREKAFSLFALCHGWASFAAIG
jgi:hypothetical protein